MTPERRESMDQMKVRILTDTIPAWLAPHLAQHDVTVGDKARRGHAAELWPTGYRPRKHGRTHGTAGTYVYGCRCDDCRDAWRRYRAQRRRSGRDR